MRSGEGLSVGPAGSPAGSPVKRARTTLEVKVTRPPASAAMSICTNRSRCGESQRVGTLTGWPWRARPTSDRKTMLISELAVDSQSVRPSHSPGRPGAPPAAANEANAESNPARRSWLSIR
jgi:hypothetical protein